MGGLESGYYSDGKVAYRTRTTRTHHRAWVRTPVGLPRSRSLLPFDINGGKVPKSARFTAHRHLWEGDSLSRWPVKDSMAVLCGDLKATFDTGLVCVAVQQGKAMYC